MHFRFLALFNVQWARLMQADYSYLINASRCNPIAIIHRVDVQRSSDHFQLRLKLKAQFKQFKVFFFCFKNCAKSNHFRLSWIPPDDWWVEQRKKKLVLLVKRNNVYLWCRSEGGEAFAGSYQDRARRGRRLACARWRLRVNRLESLRAFVRTMQRQLDSDAWQSQILI